MSGTTCFYNGVLLQDCSVEEFDQSIERDDSQSDVLYSRVRVTVSSMVVSMSSLTIDPEIPAGVSSVHPSSIDFPAPTGVESGREIYAPDRVMLIQRRLQQNRQDFWLAVHGASTNPTQTTPTLDANDNEFRFLVVGTGTTYEDMQRLGVTNGDKILGPYGPTTVPRDEVLDAMNGPNVLSARVSRVVGGRMLRVVLTVELVRCLCTGAAQPLLPPAKGAVKTTGLLNHRWSFRQSIGKDMRKEWTLEGVAIVRDRRYKWWLNAVLKGFVLMPPYTRMTGHRNEVDPSGLKMRYAMTFQQEGDAPPDGLVDWSGTYTEDNSIGKGITLGSMQVRVLGMVVRPPGQTAEQQKTMMLRLAFAIVLSRISGLVRQFNPVPGQLPKNVILERGTVMETLGKPQIDVSVQVRYTAGDGEVDPLNEMNLRLANLGKPLQIDGYDARWWPSLTSGYIGEADTEDQISLSGYDPATIGSVFTAPYPQSPCDDWHGIQLAFLTDTSGEEIDLNVPGSRYAGQNYSGGDSSQQPFEAYEVPSIRGDLQDIYTPPVLLADMGSINLTEQLAGFSYLQYDMDVTYDTNEGLRHYPLSKARSSQYTTGVLETSTVVRLHAPICKRVIEVVATRQGAAPKIPLPKSTRMSQTAGNAIVERLLESKVIGKTPYTDTDNSTMVYGLQHRLVYSMSRPIGYQQVDGESSLSDYLELGSSPIDKTTKENNALALGAVYDQTQVIQ